MAEAVAAKGSTSKAHGAPWLLTLDALAGDEQLAERKNVGGKASRLAWLRRHGFLVPETWVLPQKAFTAALRELPPACEPRSLLRAATGRGVYARAAEARQELLKVKLPSRLEEELAELWERHGASAPWGFAVRSSATAEDGALISMAGLAESVLGVRGPTALADAVRRVWASIASGRALGYLAAHGMRDVGMAVVLQPIVRATAAGVMFTRKHGGPRERIVNAGFGLGSPVVDGVTSPDMLRIGEDGHVIESIIARKPRAAVVGDEGLIEIAVDKPDEPVLDAAHIAELTKLARKLETIEDVPWDVEFACEGDRIWLVQVRPVTGRGFPEGGDASTVWSSVNVGEALPGVATPFTWSVAGDYSESGFRKAFGTLGCTVPKHARLVGNVYGRFYLNLTQFMQIAAQVPWLDPRTLVDLGGGSGGEELARQVGDVSHKRFFARLPLTATRLLKEQMRLDAQVAAFEQEAEAGFRLHNALDLAILPDEGVARKIRDVQALLERTGDVMLTCASSALGTHVILKHVISRVEPLGAERVTHDLTRGIRDLESARPAIGVMRIVTLARRDPEARAVLESEDATVSAIPDGPTKRALVSFLDLYGDRAVREAELSTPRWKEDPRAVLAMIRVALRGEARDVEQGLSRAKLEADAEMQRLVPRLNFAEQTLVRHLVARAQKAARRREQMRTWVTRVLGMLREVALDADRRLLRLVPELASDWAQLRRAEPPKGGRAEASASTTLATTHTVFFLTVDEVVNALRSSRTDLAPLVRARRAEYLRDRARPDPPTTFIGSPPSVQLPPSGGHVLRGTGASSGVVEGRARVLLSASEMSALEPGEILVVHTTDVGWTPLFCIAAGVVTELGGPLSHAAVVARELGVPSVVNVDGVTRALKSGDRVRIDGERGIVERLPST
ncbi:MAG: phosphoenolpyruvate synthase [Deltaproteobacteria bacterium]|nr:phosphoenolpyruvate synthase [Deltaproteobacteria bacterium]